MPISKMVRMTFPRKKGEPDLDELVPEFDWDEFKKLPLAREFVRKKYEEALRKLAEDIQSGKHGTSRNHLKSMRAVLARMHITVDKDKLDWLDQRDWSKLQGKHPNPDVAEKTIRSYAMHMRANKDASHVSVDQRKKMADLVALLADKPDDVMADWLFEKFTNDDDELISNL